MTKGRVKFSLSLVAVIALIALVVGVVGGRASGNSSSSSGGGAGGKTAGKKVDVIIKASDSSFWQTMLAGARKAGGDYGLKVGLFGPTSETDINQQVQLIENSMHDRGAAGALRFVEDETLATVVELHASGEHAREGRDGR